MIWRDLLSMSVLAGTVNAIEKVYSCVAPGSPVMAAPLFVEIPAAVYDVGSVRESVPVPKLNVSLEELLVPVIVTVPPVLPEEAVDWMAEVSGLPCWRTVRSTSSQLAAFQVTVVEREFLPVLLDNADMLTVSFPLPLVFDGCNQFE